MSRKRRSLDEPDYTWDDPDTSRGLLDRLQSELERRLNKVDAYVDERKLEIERIEAASRAELEEASKRLDARELRVAETERSVAAETEKLQALRGEALKFYEDLVRQLPDIQARVQLTSSTPALKAANCSSAQPPPPPPLHSSAPAPPPQLPPQQQQQQQQQQRQHPSHFAPGRLRPNGTASAAPPAVQAANGCRPGPQPEQARPPGQPYFEQQGWVNQEGARVPGSGTARVDHAAAASKGAPESAFAGVDILRGSQAPRPVAQPQQNGNGPGGSVGPASSGGQPGRAAERSFPFQIVRGRGRGNPAKQQQQQQHVPRGAPAPILAGRGRTPMEGGGGRYGRRGRGRQTPGRAGGRGESDGDSLDEAVKMLRAEADQKAAGLANGSASVAGRLDPAGADGRRVKARLRASTPAQPALQADAPALLGLLKEKNILHHMALLDPAAPHDSGADGGPSSAQLSELYGKLHAILGRILTPLPGKRSGEHSADAADGGAAGPGGGAAAAERRERYTLCALQCLIEAAGKFETAASPVRWGWCRELQAFLFVFEAANRIVVEKPEYANASYFFDLEEPLPVAAQVQRLVAVLSVPAVTRGALLTDGAPDLATGLPEADAAVLRAAGWTPQNGLRSLLNFSGERIIHNSSRAASEADTWRLYRDKITKLLSQGAAAGRTYKPVAGA